MRRKRRPPELRSLPGTLLICALVLAALFFFGLCFGRYHVTIEDTFRILLSAITRTEQTADKMAQNSVLLVRLPRLIGAMLIGSGLALAGGSYQSIFQNPLVSPDLLGVSSGACIGAAAAILAGGSSLTVQVCAFLGGLGAVFFTTMLPRLMRKKSSVTLVLSGIIVSGACSSIMGILKYVADPESELAEITYWQMGNLGKITQEAVLHMAPVMLVCIIGLLVMRWRINILSLGDREAQSLGANLRLERSIVIVFSTILTASSVCLAGTISWVGLIMPHIARSIVGSDNQRMFPVTALISACFMLVIDSLARGLTGGEIPVSILTGLVGAPFFAVILAKEVRVD